MRFDGTIDETQREKMAATLPLGASLKLGQSHAGRRTYGLVEGPDSLEPVEAEASFPQAHWYDGTIIALAIEPTPAHVLPAIEGALGGDGAPAGVLECTIEAETAIVEFRPELTPPALILDLVDVELRRFHGTSASPLFVAIAACTHSGVTGVWFVTIPSGHLSPSVSI